MKTSIEISYYPLHDAYLLPIQDFIDRLNTHSEIVVKTNGMSTQVFGEYDSLMAILTAEIKRSIAVPASVFVLKIINADLQTYHKP